jgi:hypothetical protein
METPEEVVFLLTSAVAPSFGVVESAHAQDDYKRTLIHTLRLTKTERVALKRFAASDPQLAPCIDRLATDERLEADLLPVIGRSVPTPESARPILAFLSSSTGRKFSAAVERRQPELKPTLLRPIVLPGGVPMSSSELTPEETREINDFFRSDHGAALLSILRETAGFAQLTRGLSQRKTFAAECGISVR